MDPDMEPVVFDVGTGQTKIGYSKDSSPRSVFPTVVGRPKNPVSHCGEQLKDCYVGDEAVSMGKRVKMKFPVDKGHPSNWNDFEKIIHFSFYKELKITPEEHPLFMTETSREFRERKEKKETGSYRIPSIMFETFNVPGFYLSTGAACSLYANGKSTGLVVDSGYGKVEVTPVYEGFPIYHSIQHLPLGVKDIITFMVDQGIGFTRMDAKLFWIRSHFPEITRQCCFVKEKFEGKQPYSSYNFSTRYEFNKDEYISLGPEVFLGPEMIFTPEISGKSDHDGVVEMVIKSIKDTDVDLRKELLQNILFVGGLSLMKGYKERIIRGIEKEFPNFNVLASSNDRRKCLTSCWEGGALISSQSYFQNWWITKDEYDEDGSWIVNRKC